ncbi:MAG: hypothetical protein IJJ26_07215 [Victivallales bacterium]|nr:hypothetical protein [Victivallales bacterium]
MKKWICVAVIGLISLNLMAARRGTACENMCAATYAANLATCEANWATNPEQLKKCKQAAEELLDLCRQGCVGE